MKPDKSRPLPGWARVLVQSALIALFVLFAFWAVYRFQNKLAITSLGASAFIAFGFPAAESSRVRYLLGGYLCGLAGGLLCSLLCHEAMGFHLENAPMALIGFCALAVFITALLMLGLKLQHPPAAALAISIVLDPKPLVISAVMLGCILVLCAARWAVMKLLGSRLDADGA
ncbi:HPP family protein [Ruminococcaceae bacterium OttesenSCG-928-D13]|nr:HPP family protein [Ruminococcaceae bacterium OttesenSCG-928-D13]